MLTCTSTSSSSAVIHCTPDLHKSNLCDESSSSFSSLLPKKSFISSHTNEILHVMHNFAFRLTLNMGAKFDPRVKIYITSGSVNIFNNLASYTAEKNLVHGTV